MKGLRSVKMLLGLLMLMIGMVAPAAQAQISGNAILLVASVKMTDPRFARTVVLVTRHGRSPPLGVILNRPLDTALGTLFPKLPENEAKRPVFLGGPISPNMVAFLFRSPTGSKDAISVTPDVHLGRSGVTLAELLRGPRTHTGLRVFIGYSGWAEGQLENEIRHGGWHVLPVDSDIVFDKDIDLIWPDLIRRATQQNAGHPQPWLLSLHATPIPNPFLPPLIPFTPFTPFTHSQSPHPFSS